MRLLRLVIVPFGVLLPGLAWGQASTQPTAPVANREDRPSISSWRIGGIDQHNRLLLARAASLGKTDGLVLLATEMGRTGAVLDAAAALGADVQSRFDDVGYARVRIPLSRFAQVRAIPGVLIAQIDASTYIYAYDLDNVRYEKGKVARGDSIRADSVRRDSTARDSALVAQLPMPPAAALAAESPFVTANDMRSVDLRRMDSRFDGRGITVAVLEAGTLDFLHPALQTARTLSGDSVAKIRGVIAPLAYERDIIAPATLLGDDALYAGLAVPDRNRVRRSRFVTVADGKFSVDDSAYTIPGSGTYSYGRLARGKTSHAVLWDDTRKLIWVDTDGDRDFGDEQAMADINTRFNAGLLKALDSTAKEPKRSVSFAVQFDSIPGMVRIFEGRQGHQTMVATVAAGHNLLGGAANASAPGAQIIIVDAGGALHRIIEGFVRAERDPRVDVITSSQIGEGFPSTGESLLALVLNRSIEVYQKPIFASAHNSGPLTNSTGEPAATPRVISVGGYVGGPTYRAQYGWELAGRDWLIHYSSRGPAVNGNLKPDLVAPVIGVAGNVCRLTTIEKTLAYQFPPCWSIGGGTSSASPHAAGAAALLMSAARQSGLPHDAQHLSWALRMGARYLPTYAAHEQGNGLVDVVRALELLKLGVALPEIEVRAPVKSALSRYLRDPGFGPGLYEREGWTSGDVRTRTITLTRRSGPAAPVTYALRWRGDDGTFSSPMRAATLPLNVPVAVPVRVAPTKPGMHSAQLQIVDRGADVPVHEVLATVIAAERFTPQNGYAVRRTAKIPWQGAASFYVDIPPGTASLRLDLGVARGKAHVRLSDMGTGFATGIPYQRPYRYPTRVQEIVGGQHAVHILPDPDPGVMEILVEPFNTARWGADSAEYRVASEVELVASIQRVTGDVSARSVRPGEPAEVAFVNEGASLGEAAVAAEAGVRRELRGVAERDHPYPQYNIVVDSGATSLRVALDAGSADLALYLYDCAGTRCALWDVSLRDAGRQSLLVVKPRAGLWKVVVDPRRVPASGATFTYTEVLTHPKYGSADRGERRTAQAVGARWRDVVTFRAGGAAPYGYDLVGVADVVDEAMERAERERPLAKFDDHLTPFRPARLGTVVVPLGKRITTAATTPAGESPPK